MDPRSVELVKRWLLNMAASKRFSDADRKTLTGLAILLGDDLTTKYRDYKRALE